MEYHILATNVCNLACSYCFEKYRIAEDPFVIDEATLESIYSKILAYQRKTGDRRIAFSWTGGEVLTIPLARLKRYFSLQKKIFPRKFRITNDLQTNLFELDDAILGWIKRQRQSLAIGVSFDFVDEARLSRDGTPSRGQVFRNMQRLRKAGVPFFIICTVSNHNIHCMESIYDWMVENGVNFHFMPIFHSTYTSKKRDLIDPVLYARNLLHLIKKHIQNPAAGITFQNAKSYVAALLKDEKGERLCELSNTGECGSAFVMINASGEVYPCSCMEFEEFFLGNCLDDDFEDVMSPGHGIRRLLRKRARELKKTCSGCRWNPICSKGCPRVPALSGSFVSRDPAACRINKTIFRGLAAFYRRRGEGSRLTIS